jgi:hypothetical protein
MGFGAHWFPILNVGATIAVLLFTYGLWSLGSPLWALPVFIGLIALVTARSGRFSGKYIGVRPVARACIPLVAILILSNTNAAHNFWYAPYLGAAAAMTVIGVVQAGGTRARAVALAVAACAAIVLLPTQFAPSAPAASVALLFAIALAGGGAALAMRRRYPAQSRLGEAIPAVTAMLTAGAVAGAEYLRVVPTWIIQ